MFDSKNFEGSLEVIKTPEERIDAWIKQIEHKLDAAVTDQDIAEAELSFDALIDSVDSVTSKQNDALSELKKRFVTEIGLEDNKAA